VRLERKERRLQSGKKRGAENQGQNDDEKNDQPSERHSFMRWQERDRMSSGKLVLGLLII
jgi:hypothetical protein